MRLLLFASLLSAACLRAQGPGGAAAAPGGFVAGPSMAYDPQIVTTLLKLLEAKDSTRPANSEFTSPCLKDLISMGTPAGFQLRNRYLRLGVPLAQALVATDDPRLKDQLIELARWERNPEIRAVALITLGTRREEAHTAFFREALTNIEPEVRFAALEALELWDLPPAKEEFKKAARSDRSPILKVYAAQALARRGDPYGIEVLRQELASGSWVARAMSAKYLGDLGEGPDYDRVLDRMSQEQQNDFVTAELAIAALKLFPKKSPPPPAPPPPASPPSATPPPPAGAAAMSLYAEFELEPLVIKAPRFKIPATLAVDGRVNAALLRLLETKADERPKEEELQDSGVMALNTLSSPVGFALKTRYTELGFLLTEGLAGTADLVLREKILKVARSGRNPQVRAAALLAAAYSKDPGDRGLFQEALLSPDVTVRFGALEALETWGRPEASSDIGNAARLDLAAHVRVYAAAMLSRLGDPSGRDFLLRGIDDSCWVARAMANRYVGDLGVTGDFDRILFNLGREDNLFVRAEMTGALLRLHALRSRAPGQAP